MRNYELSQNEKSASTRPPALKAPSKQTAIDFRPSRDEVARRAYSIFLDQGSPQGRDVQHWLEAEAQAMKARKVGRGSILM
jgi:hypothetical protein